MLHLQGAAQGSAVVWRSPPCMVWTQKSQTTARRADLFIARPFSQTTKHSSGQPSAWKAHRSRAEHIRAGMSNSSPPPPDSSWVFFPASQKLPPPREALSTSRIENPAWLWSWIDAANPELFCFVLTAADNVVKSQSV